MAKIKTIHKNIYFKEIEFSHIADGSINYLTFPVSNLEIYMKGFSSGTLLLISIISIYTHKKSVTGSIKDRGK